MLFRNLLDLRLSQRGEIRGLGGDDSPKRLWMMGLQILTQEFGCIALSRAVSNEDDRFGMNKIRGYLLIVGVLLGNMIPIIGVCSRNGKNVR